MSPQMYAIENVNVIPMDAERVLTAQTVITQNGRINNIGDAISTKIPAGAHRIDAAGQYLIPALADMHVHLEGDAWKDYFLIDPAGEIAPHQHREMCRNRPYNSNEKNRYTN